MKITFITSKSNQTAVSKELAPFVTKASAQMSIRDHTKRNDLIVVEVSNNMVEAPDNFKKYLLMREHQGMLMKLKIEEADRSQA